MKLIRNIFLALLVANSAWAQYSVIPGEAQSKPILLKGAVAHIGNGQVIQNSIIGFDQGKLTLVGDATTARVDESGYEVIDVSGKHAYPGFILPNTNLGLTEVSAVRHTRDNQERGNLNPNVRSIVAYNTDSELIPTLRFNGVLTAQTTPQSGTISGSSSIVQLDAWNWEDAVLKMDESIHMNWPSKISRRFDFTSFSFQTQNNKNYGTQVDELKQLFSEAKNYSELSGRPTNLKLEALVGLFDGSKILQIHVNQAKEIVESVKMAKEMGVQKIVLEGAREVMLVKDFVKDNNIPVILRNLHTTPSSNDLDIDISYKMPYLLHQAGIKYCIGFSSGGGTSYAARNLPFTAGTAAAYGLTPEQALTAITLSTAQIIGIDDQLGSLEDGKDATLFISEGDALDMRTNKLTHAFIQGRKVKLTGMQQELYEKYKNKYGHGQD